MFKTSTTNPKFEYIYLFGLAVVQVFSNWGSPYIMNHISIGRKRGLIYGLAIICVCAILSTIFNHISSTVVFGLVAVVQAVNTVTFAVNICLSRLSISILLNFMKLYSEVRLKGYLRLLEDCQLLYLE